MTRAEKEGRRLGLNRVRIEYHYGSWLITDLDDDWDILMSDDDISSFARSCIAPDRRSLPRLSDDASEADENFREWFHKWREWIRYADLSEYKALDRDDDD